MEATPAGLVLAGRVGRATAHLKRGASGGRRGFARPERLMTGAQLRAYLSLADTGSFAEASRAAGLTQQAISRSVRGLEQIVGFPLVERTGHRITVSERGHRLARSIRLAQNEIATALAEISEAPAGFSVRIGAMPLSRARLLPAALARFAAQWPGAEIVVIEGSWRELVEPLRDGVIDFTIGALREDGPDDLAQTSLLVDRPVIVARAGHPLLGKDHVTSRDLARFPWIVGPKGSPLRSAWENLFDGHLLPPAPVECGSVLVNRQLLLVTDFLTLLSPDKVAVETQAALLGVIA